MAQRLTKEQAAIIGVYTGFTAGPFSDIHELIDTKFPGVTALGLTTIGGDKLREAFHDEYMAIVYKPSDAVSV